MVELKQEIKTEMLDMFKEMLVSLKDELRQHALSYARDGVI
jgi:hypothetical protein